MTKPLSTRQRAVEMYRAGHSARAVAAALDVGVSYVLAAVRQAGIVRPRGRRPARTQP